MKTKIATALSIVGVLGAGSAAALVNTQILDSGPSESSASAAVLPPTSTIELEIPEVETSTTTVAPTTAPTTVAPAISLPSSTSTTEAPPAPSGYLTAFNVGDAGVVTVDVLDGRLVLVAAEPKSGWDVTKAEDDSNDDDDEDDNQVEVEFTSPTVRVEFEAEFVDGQIVPHVESKSIGGSSSGSSGSSDTPAAAPTTMAPSTPSTSVDDHEDDDHDEYDDDDSDDRDDDRYEDESHDDEDDHGSDDDHEDDDRDDD
jgi:hypothetical protein